MKLLAVTGYYKPAYVYGGPVRSEAALFESLSRLGVDVTVITTNLNGENKLDVPLLKPMDVGGVKVIYCPTRPAPGSAFYSPAQIDAAKQHILTSDIVNLQTFWTYAAGPLSRYCMRHQIPYYVSLRGQLMDYAMKQTGLIKVLKKRLFLLLMGYQFINGAAALHCTSAREASDLKAYPIRPPTFLVPNGIDVQAYQKLPPPGQMREQYHIPEEALVMVMIGRLDAVKNPHFGISALIASQILEKPIHLLVVGPDEQNFRSSLEKQAHQAGCADRLHFTGLLNKDGLLQAMADSDLLIMPSQSENFGMSAAESMAAGLPILVTEIVPVGTWAKQACAGETAPCNEVAFSQAVVAMLSQPAKLKEMGQNGRKAAAGLFGYESIAVEMRTHLEQIVERTNQHHA